MPLYVPNDQSSASNSASPSVESQRVVLVLSPDAPQKNACELTAEDNVRTVAEEPLPVLVLTRIEPPTVGDALMAVGSVIWKGRTLSLPAVTTHAPWIVPADPKVNF